MTLFPNPRKIPLSEKSKATASKLSNAVIKRKHLREFFRCVRGMISAAEKWIFLDHLADKEKKFLDHMSSEQSMNFLNKITKEEIDIQDFKKNDKVKFIH